MKKPISPLKKQPITTGFSPFLPFVGMDENLNGSITEI